MATHGPALIQIAPGLSLAHITPPSFNPLTLIAGKTALYIDFSLLTKLFQVSDGTVAVAAATEPIGWAKSLDDSERISTQATAGSRGTWQTGSIWRGDGTDDNLLTTLNPSAALTIAAKVLFNAASDVVIGSSTSTTGRAFMATDGAGKLQVGAGSDVKLGPSDIRGSWGVVIATFSGTSVKAWRNGISQIDTTFAGAINTTIPFRVGASNNSGTGTAFLNGDIKFAMAYNAAISDADVANLTGAWGTT